MASTISSNPDLPRHSSLCSLTFADLHGNPTTRNFGSMSMDDLLKNIYTDAAAANLSQPDPPFQSAAVTGVAENVGGSSAVADPSLSRQGSFSLPKTVGNKTVDEVWKEIVSGSEQRRGVGEGLEEMTLEDFLAKAGAVREEDVRVPVVPGLGNYGADSMFQSQSVVEGGGASSSVAVGFVNATPGRGKRRAVEEPVDKVTQQKQRRMIKNRESAARSRERKQAYTVELESMVTQLMEDNERMLREEAEQTKERFKQLMKNLIPVVEERKPPRILRRVRSLDW